MDNLSVIEWRSYSEDFQINYFINGDGKILGDNWKYDHDRRNVGILCPCLENGGGEQHQLMMLKTIDRDKINWTGLCVTDQFKNDNHKKFLPYIPVGFGLKAAQKIIDRSDIILTWSNRKFENIKKCIFISHFANNKISIEYDDVVAVSELAKIDTDTRVILNAVDEERLKVNINRNKLKDRWQIPKDSLVAGYIGRFAPEKGVNLISNMAKELPDPWHTVMVGNGQIIIKSTNRLHVKESRSNIGDILNLFDVLIVPSIKDSFCLVTAEGFFTKTPVLNTNTGISKMFPGFTKNIPENCDGKQLAQIVLEDWNHEKQRKERVKKAYNLAKEKFTSKRFGEEWTGFLCDVEK